MAVQFKPAERRKRKLRLCLDGPSGSGKSCTGLAILRGIIGDEGRMAVIDTEHESIEEYAGVFPGTNQPTGFDTVALTDFAVERYMEAIDAATAAKYDALLIDSGSHAWAGKGGILEFVDTHAGSEGAYFSKDGWRKATPKQHRFIDKIIGAPLHVVVTLRDKTKYVQEENANGKIQPRRVGMEPIQRDGFEYEFSILGTMDAEHVLRIHKSRTLDAAGAELKNFLQGAVIPKPGIALGRQIAEWFEAAPGEWKAPAFSRTFKVGERIVESSGITEDTYVKAAQLGAKLDKAAGAGSARGVLNNEPFRVPSMAQLDEEQGLALVAVLEEEVTKAEAAKAAKGAAA